MPLFNIKAKDILILTHEAAAQRWQKKGYSAAFTYKLIPVFKEYGDTNIEIFGYTDSSGKPEYNLTLSEKRAESVKTYLIGKGLDANRFKTSGFGIADPIAPNETPEGMAKNRRVEFAITANAKMIQDAKNGQ